MTSSYNFSTVYQTLRAEYAQLSHAPLDDSFWTQLSSLNVKAYRCAFEALQTEVPELCQPSSQIAVAVTGSDSRQEKCGLGSPLECIIISPTKELTPAQAQIVAKISQLCSNSEGLLYSSIERKGLDKDCVSLYEGQSSTRTIPTRAFDALYLAGDVATFFAYKQKLVNELRDPQFNLKPFRKEFLDTSFQNLRQELNNSPRKNPLLTLDSGKVYYEKAGRRGLKHDLLRTVQYSIAFLLFRAVHTLRLQQEELSSVPQTVIGRLEWLRQKKFTSLTDEEYTLLERMYTQASYWYTQLTACAVEEAGLKTVTVMQLDLNALRPAIQTIQDLCKKMLT